MKYKLSPIVLFTYNRAGHTKQTVEALKQNKLADISILYIFSDGAKNDEDIDKVNKVREYINTINGFKKVIVIERQKNKGLANSIISGVTEIIKKHGKVIVLEDDLITSNTFLCYMNNLLHEYKNEDKIYSITAYNHSKKLMEIPKNYNYDIYFCPRACSWSWGTWKDRWKHVDWNIQNYNEFLKNKKLQRQFNKGGNDMSNMLISQMNNRIDSWAIRWCYHHFINRAYCVYPIKSYINNIGHDGSGIHCRSQNKFKNINLNNNASLKIPKTIQPNNKINKRFKKVYNKNYKKEFIIKLLKLLNLYNFYKKLKNKLI
ncbi:MAG: glycosyltransferase [Candidatus Pacebacteria bacterium]|nr:glycosyltransferase [Candidatus Paceibacterota bacterium]